MRVLFYNWCPIHDSEGGGIAVYIRNLLTYIHENSSDIEPVFLSSGFYYDNKKTPYVREETAAFGAKVYSIVNSPVYAPMRAPENNFVTMLTDETLIPVFYEFIKEQGPFDVIHFNTFEGLSLKALRVKNKLAKTKFVYSVHNYTSVCPNVMLWTEQGENCETAACKDNCHICMQRYNRPGIRALKLSRRLLEKQHGKLYYYTRGYKFVSRKFFPVKKGKTPQIYQEYVRESIECINRYIDTVLAVSEKVRDILVRRGVDSQKTQVCYIGTKFAETAVGKARTNPESSPFGIVYMGYMREEKGFYFLLEALERIKPDLAANIRVTLASKVTDRSAAKRIEALKQKYSEIRLFNGYQHKDIPDILNNAHVGIVPVLWEDNLPQVAIEMIASGVPVLASSFGGASELNDSDAFRFEGGNLDDFMYKLNALYSDREKLNGYWSQTRPLTTMSMHVSELRKVYEDS